MPLDHVVDREDLLWWGKVPFEGIVTPSRDAFVLPGGSGPCRANNCGG